MIRRAIGGAYAERDEPERAIRHLEIARALAPEDPEVHAALVEALTDLGDEEAACRALLRAPRSADLLLELADRFDGLGREADAGRALTGIVEADPLSGEAHRALAKVYEERDRLDDAIRRWRRVTEARKTLEHILAHRWNPDHDSVTEEAHRFLKNISR